MGFVGFRFLRSSGVVSRDSLWLTSLIAFGGGGTGWLDEGRAVDGGYLTFVKALDTISHDILLGRCRLDEQH